MSEPKVLSPQLITNSEMVYLVWEAADKEALARYAPEGYRVSDQGTVYMNQYWVTDQLKHSNGAHPNGWGAYSLTYLGVELADHDLVDGTPCRWWTHYYNSSETMRTYASDRGIPAAPGRTHLSISGTAVEATTFIDEKPMIRSNVTFESRQSPTISGQLLYLTRHNGKLEKGRYPFVGNVMESFECQSVEFLAPNSAFYDLRPADPLTVTFGFYSPNLTFVYPGGQQMADEQPF